MTIFQLYQQYQIPLNLQEHMLRVASVGWLICNNLNSDQLNKELVITTLLLHDMGNIIKFKFDRLDLLTPQDQQDVDKLRQIQREFQKRYGDSADEATLQIMSEIGVSESAIDLCARSHGDDLQQILSGDDWEAKICFYADMRVGPLGVLSLAERFADLEVRYAYKADEIRSQAELAQQLERQIQAGCDLELSQINDSDTAQIMLDLCQREIIYGQP